ncbi:MAG: hypothetical protein H6712_34500 [Myxococcales bacterium]|nr:hypothetical protein [Myxococcales bacterium]MCB9719007.1 hypothetical protein [Myxococcales bacterium]
MARIPVAELRVQTQVPGLVRAEAATPARSRADLRVWAERAPVSSGAMVGLGLGLAVVGGVGALVVSGVGFFGMLALSTMITLGGGMAFLGVLKRKGRKDQEAEALKALPPASAPAVIAERGRRVIMVLEQHGDLTFERLLAQLRWTEGALLETLVAMKDAGRVVEDLDLETGEWVYRSQLELGAGGPMTLADRQAQRLS